MSVELPKGPIGRLYSPLRSAADAEALAQCFATMPSWRDERQRCEGLRRRSSNVRRHSHGKPAHHRGRSHRFVTDALVVTNRADRKVPEAARSELEFSFFFQAASRQIASLEIGLIRATISGLVPCSWFVLSI